MHALFFLVDNSLCSADYDLLIIRVLDMQIAAVEGDKEGCWIGSWVVGWFSFSSPSCVKVEERRGGGGWVGAWQLLAAYR